MPVLFEREKEEILFIHIPKCGGNSVLDLLHKNGWVIKESRKLTGDQNRHGHMPYEHWKKFPIFVEPDYKFALVRNPLDRIVSHCEMWMKHICDKQLTHTLEQCEKIIETNQYDAGALEKISHFCSPLTEIFLQDADFLMKFSDSPRALAEAVDHIFNHLNSESKENQFHIRRFLSARAVENFLNISLLDIPLEKLLEMYLDESRFKIGEIGTNPTPAYLHVSPETKIHKLENVSTLLDELHTNKIISEESFRNGFPKVNAKRFGGFLTDKPRDFGEKSNFRKEFLDLYQKDYEVFDYELNI